MSARVFGNDISFLVDTGAAVLLISSDVWDRIKPSSAPAVNPVSLRLVGVDGTPLQIQGSVTINLDVSGLVFQQELIIVKALTSDGILGLNFLKGNNCVLNLAQGKLCSSGAQISGK